MYKKSLKGNNVTIENNVVKEDGQMQLNKHGRLDTVKLMDMMSAEILLVVYLASFATKVLGVLLISRGTW